MKNLGSFEESPAPRGTTLEMLKFYSWFLTFPRFTSCLTPTRLQDLVQQRGHKAGCLCGPSIASYTICAQSQGSV